MPPTSADRNMLFGIIALQMDFITRDQLIAAMHGWVVDKATPIGQILVDQGALAPRHRDLLEPMVDAHVEQHLGDAAKSLASVTAGRSSHDALAAIDDADVQASLCHVTIQRDNGDPLATKSWAAGESSHTWSAGESTSDGMRFRVLRQHAKGGLGVVYVARDSELPRDVALKEIQDSHADESTSRSRFLLEAEITGGLEHPGIVPVYGLGVYRDGRPFYAMRFVRGESLKGAIARFHGQPKTTRIDTIEFRRLVRRFLDVCNAIEYAHSRGVLHRDLKPGNIMIGKYGETLVVDWGLAKTIGDSNVSDGDVTESLLIPPSASGSGAIETLPGTAVGTPAFMSPEQAAGRLDLLGPQSDVYGLGATFYMLLTGRAPFEDRDLGVVLQRVQKGDYVHPKTINTSIPAPLDAICCKAMATKIEDRYATPKALADDIDHWLADEPVTARRDPWHDRARRWSRKHRTLVTTAGALLVAGLMGMSTFAAILRGKNRELGNSYAATLAAESEANRWLDQAMAAIKDYHSGFAEEALTGEQIPKAMRERLLAKPVQFYQKLTAELAAKSTPRTREKVLLAQGRDNLASVLSTLGRLEEAHRERMAVVALSEELLAAQPASLEHSVGLAASHYSLGVVLFDSGQWQAARDAFTQAINEYEAVVAQRPQLPELRRMLANSYASLGNAYREAGNPIAARKAYDIGLSMFKALVDAHPLEPTFQNDLGTAYINASIVISRLGEPEASRDATMQAISIYERLSHDQPDTFEYEDRLANTLNNLSVDLRDAGDAKAARDAALKAGSIYERLVAKQPGVFRFQQMLAVCEYTLGFAQLSLGDAKAAREACEKSISRCEALLAIHPGVAKLLLQQAKCHNIVGVIQFTSNDAGAARSEFEKAAERYSSLVAMQPGNSNYQYDLADTYTNLGGALQVLGRRNAARQAHEKSLDIRERLVREHPDVPNFASGLAATVNNIASIDLEDGQFEKARDKLLRAVALQKTALAKNPAHSTYRQFLGNHLRNLVRAADGLGDSRIATDAQRQLDELNSTVAVLDNGPVVQPNGGVASKLTSAQRAYDAKKYATASRLWGEAVKIAPSLANDRAAQVCYNAACAAALAGCGGGIDDPALTVDIRMKFRLQALEWLKAELDLWAKLLESANHEQRAAIAQTLDHWQSDPDLAGIRDEADLAKLTEAEQTAFRKLWADVDALLARAQGPIGASKKARESFPSDPFSR